nr:alpha/beta hydrolase [Mesorhizobium sp.]
MATKRGEEVVRHNGREFARFLWESWSPSGWFDDELFDKVAPSFENPDWANVTLHSYRVRWREAEPDPRYTELARRQIAAKTISVPVVMLHGEDDRVVPARSSEGKERHFTGGYDRWVLPGVGHFPTREAPRQVGEIMKEFLIASRRQSSRE